MTVIAAPSVITAISMTVRRFMSFAITAYPSAPTRPPMLSAINTQPS